MEIFVGCAGWSLRKELAGEFRNSGTHLERYAVRLGAVEVNSSFYRPHRMCTYERWAASTPDDFRFAVKLPKEITHISRLVDTRTRIAKFCSEINSLDGKLGPVLMQLPPSLAFEASLAKRFFTDLRAYLAGPVACEPRHSSWFCQDAEMLLTGFGIGRVAADPSMVTQAAQPGGCQRNCYYRWHGSPRMYFSTYSQQSLAELANQLLASAESSESVWCIFDNTAEGAALKNALEMSEMLN